MAEAKRNVQELQERMNKDCCIYLSFAFLGKGFGGNRSLGAKERFPPD